MALREDNSSSRLSYSGHHSFCNGFGNRLGQIERARVGDDLNRLASRVHHYVACLAMGKVILELLANFGRQIAFQVVPDLGHEIRATDQKATPFTLPVKCGDSVSRSIKRPRRSRAFRAGIPSPSAAAASSAGSCSISRSMRTTRYFAGSFITPLSIRERISVLEYNFSGSSVHA